MLGLIWVNLWINYLINKRATLFNIGRIRKIAQVPFFYLCNRYLLIITFVTLITLAK